mgnify:CR=1 FL=1|tara:strand:+ start:15120 stop:15497 length:378 start_codon:yes stop_codon:yes gene_type:complete
MNKKVLLTLSIFLISGCAGMFGLQEYKASNPKAMGTYGLEGYLDEEIAEGVYMVEYFGDPGYAKIDHAQLMGYAKRRASELCPSGYTDELKIITMPNAYFEPFRCFSQICVNAEVIASGKVTCAK